MCTAKVIPRTHVFQVEQGVIAVYKTLVDGRRQIIDFAYPGDLIGLGVLREHVLSAQAVCTSKVRCLSTTALERAAEADANLAIKLYRAVCQELAATRHLLVTVGQRSAAERLASFLLTLHRRLGGPSNMTVNLAMRRSDIADLLGLTIETVSRTIAKLRTMGIIEVEQGGTHRPYPRLRSPRGTGQRLNVHSTREKGDRSSAFSAAAAAKLQRRIGKGPGAR